MEIGKIEIKTNPIDSKFVKARNRLAFILEKGYWRRIQEEEYMQLKDLLSWMDGIIESQE